MDALPRGVRSRVGAGAREAGGVGVRRVRLERVLAERHPEAGDPAELVATGRVLVDGSVADNPAALVTAGASIRIAAATRPLRGETKLGWALDHFGVDVTAKACLDVGACTGGFTLALLDRGAAHVFACEAGHGQLLGSLRADARVTNLERTNLGDLDRTRVPETVDIVVIDVSYLSLALAVPQLAAVDIAAGAALVALVKPMFELGLATAPTDEPRLRAAIDRAATAIAGAGWDIGADAKSPHPGAGGAIEGWVLARRAAA